MAVNKIGTIGNRLDLLIKQGSSFGSYQLTIRNKDLTPIDVSLYTFTGNIKKGYNSTTVLATISTTIIDGVNGKVGISIPSNITATLKGNPDGVAEYVWDYEMQDGNGLIEPVFYGEVEVFSNV